MTLRKTLSPQEEAARPLTVIGESHERQERDLGLAVVG